MAYRIRHKDPDATASVRRIARQQIAAALRSIEHAQGDVGSAIHDVRKRCKKIRGLLRLVRPAFNDDRHENAAFREIAAALGQMRDAEVLIDTFDRVIETTGADAAGALAPIRDQLHTRRHELARAQDPATLLLTARGALMAAQARVDDWQLSKKGFGAFHAGLESSYRRGRKAMRAACRSGDDEDFHAWRKRCKDHGYHLRLLQPVWPGPMRAQCICAGELGDVLGAHHDLAVLGARVRAMSGVDAAAIDACIERIRTLQRGHAQRAGSLGARLYALPHAALAKSWRRRYSAWQRDAGSS